MNAIMNSSRKQLVFFLITFSLILQSSSSMAFELSSFPQNSSFPSTATTIYSVPLCFSANTTSRFASSTTYTVFLIINTIFLMAIKFDFISHTLNTLSFLQKITQDLESPSGSTICSVPLRFSENPGELSFFGSATFKTVTFDFLAQAFKNITSRLSKVNLSTKRGLSFFTFKTVTLDFFAQAFKNITSRLSKVNLSTTGGLSFFTFKTVTFDFFALAFKNITSRLSKVNLLTTGGLSFFTFKTVTFDFFALAFKNITQDSNSPSSTDIFNVPRCFSDNSITSRLSKVNPSTTWGLSFFISPEHHTLGGYSQSKFIGCLNENNSGLVNLNSTGCITVGMGSRTGISFTSWMDDQQNLEVLLTYKPENITQDSDFCNILLCFSVVFVSVGMDLRTGISFTSWIDHDQKKNLKVVFFTCFRPQNLLLNGTVDDHSMYFQQVMYLQKLKKHQCMVVNICQFLQVPL